MTSKNDQKHKKRAQTRLGNKNNIIKRIYQKRHKMDIIDHQVLRGILFSVYLGECYLVFGTLSTF